MKNSLKLLAIGWMVLQGATGALAHTALTPSGPRSSSLGGVLLAISPTAADLFTSPAATGRLEQPEIFLSGSRLFAGLADMDLGCGQIQAAYPLSLGNLGVGYTIFQAGAWWQEQALALNYSHCLWGPVYGGVTVRYLHREYGISRDALAVSDPVFSRGHARGAVAADVGASCAVLPQVSLCLAALNLNQPDLGLASPDPVGREVRVGCGLTLPKWDINLFGDIAWLRDSEVMGHFGLEKYIFQEQVTIRLGGNPSGFTAGFGLRVAEWELTYAAVFHAVLWPQDLGDHQLGLIYRPVKGGQGH